MEDKKRKIIKDGILKLAGFKIPCFNLEDGTRVLSRRGMANALKMVDEAEKGKENPPGHRLKQILSQKSLQPFVDKWLKPDIFKPIIFYKGDLEIHGYNAKLLPNICNIFSELEKEEWKKGKKLPARQAIIAERSRILLRELATVGIIALIDEATGYQYEREKNALQRVFDLLVLEDGIFSETKKFFPLGYYKDMYGVYDMDFTAENIRRKPRFIGFLTSELVYKNLPAGSYVLPKIRERTPKTKGGHPKYKHYRSLTPLGEKALMEIIGIVRTLAWFSKGDRKKFLKLVKERFHPERDLPYIDLEAMNDNPETKVDKVLGALLNTPKPKKDK